MNKVSEMVNREYQRTTNNWRDNNREKHLFRTLLIQGGGRKQEEQYEVPLVNGVDVLVASTPLCLLR